MAITLEIQGFVEAYLGLLFFGYLLTIVVHGHTSVEKPGRAFPFCKLGILCARVSVQGVGRDKWKEMEAGVHLEKLKEVKSKMMTGGYNDAPCTWN